MKDIMKIASAWVTEKQMEAMVTSLNVDIDYNQKSLIECKYTITFKLWNVSEVEAEHFAALFDSDMKARL